MGRLYVFMGKSASGKDTLYREIMEKHSELRAVVPYTTRPIRAGETEGVEYHFVTEEEMNLLESKRQIVECRCYETVKGPWYYFTANDNQMDFENADMCLISTLEGYEKIREFYGIEKVVPVYIEVDDFTRMQRALAREKEQENPCVAEVCRRFLADEEDFETKKLETLGIYNKISNHNLEDAICQIEAMLKNV